jgi:large conductance mechanosensitive channel
MPALQMFGSGFYRGVQRMWQEFKEFAFKGNALDLAIGVIIGAAFGKIVDSVVSDIIMPIIGMFGNVDFTNMFINLSGGDAQYATLAAAKTAGANVLAYGNFITILINFLILAFVIFQIVKFANKAKKAEPAPAPAAPPEDVILLREIRDALKK